jgi:predicted RecA/RadA family phage recombinase
MVKYIQPGDVVEYTAPSGGVTKDVPVLIGQLLVIPTVTVAQTLRFNGLTRGVISVTKVGSQAWAEGAVVFWDAGNSRFTTAGAGNFQAGTAVEAVGSGSGATTGVVRLDGIGREQGT